MLSVQSDEYYMKLALQEANKAFELGEIPVGAVVVSNGQILAKAHNSVEMLKDVTAHAEILAITAASQYLDSKYLSECTLFVTLEPCPMCAGALRWSQFDRVVYGAGDDKMGFMRFGKELLHPKTRLEFGILHDECSTVLKQFFQDRRKMAF